MRHGISLAFHKEIMYHVPAFDFGECFPKFKVDEDVKIHMQSAFRIDTEEKFRHETESLRRSGDFYRKFVVTSGFSLPTEDKAGIVTVGLIPFLLDASILES